MGTRRGPGRVYSQILRRSSRGSLGKRWNDDSEVVFWGCWLSDTFLAGIL